MGEKENEEQGQASAGLAKHLTFRIDGELARSLVARAAAEGIKGRQLSRFYRVLMRAGLAGGSIEQMDKTLVVLKALCGELSRIGGNLNQVAHWLNAKGSLKAPEFQASLDELRPAFKQCYAIAKELRDGIVQRGR